MSFVVKRCIGSHLESVLFGRLGNETLEDRSIIVIKSLKMCVKEHMKIFTVNLCVSINYAVHLSNLNMLNYAEINWIKYAH